MVQLFALFSTFLLLQITADEGAIGRFPFLMPKVHPYKVCLLSLALDPYILSNLIKYFTSHELKTYL